MGRLTDTRYVHVDTQMTLQRGGLAPMTTFGDTMRSQDLRSNLAVPVQDFTSGPGAMADSTMLNTVMEVSLPGFLKLDYERDLHVEARLTAGGAGTIFTGMLLNDAAIRLNGSATCAIKEVNDRSGLTAEENADRFLTEVSVLWSLSFHPNVCKLLGYCESPRLLVTRLYPTDLFRYLHAQGETEPLEAHLLLHVCAGVTAAVAAVHSMGIAHRDIKTPNVLLQEPRAGSPFPDPILCDFGLARTPDDSATAAGRVKGYSPRYAAPEVFARVHLRFVSNSVDDDKMADVYALGVVLWETTCRLVRTRAHARRWV
jgi:serine/threonine protein kinase